MDSVSVRYIAKSFLQEFGGTMRDHTITLHLSEPKTSITTSSLGRLLVQVLELSSCTSVDLVVDHMLESLVVSRSQKDLAFEHLSSERVVNSLVTMFLVTKLMHFFGDIFDSYI